MTMIVKWITIKINILMYKKMKKIKAMMLIIKIKIKMKKEIKLPQGGSVFVSTEFTGAEARELANMINQQHWGITIN